MIAKMGNSWTRVSCIRKSVQIPELLQICIQPLYTAPLVYSRSVEIHAQHTERPKLNDIVQDTFNSFPKGIRSRRSIGVQLSYLLELVGIGCMSSAILPPKTMFNMV